MAKENEPADPTAPATPTQPIPPVQPVAPPAGAAPTATPTPTSEIGTSDFGTRRVESPPAYGRTVLGDPPSGPGDEGRPQPRFEGTRSGSAEAGPVRTSDYDGHVLNREGMRRTIQSGGSVLHGGRIITKESELPSEAELAGDDPAKVQAALDTLARAREEIDRQAEKLLAGRSYRPASAGGIEGEAAPNAAGPASTPVPAGARQPAPAGGQRPRNR